MAEDETYLTLTRRLCSESLHAAAEAWKASISWSDEHQTWFDSLKDELPDEGVQAFELRTMRGSDFGTAQSMSCADMITFAMSAFAAIHAKQKSTTTEAVFDEFLKSRPAWAQKTFASCNAFDVLLSKSLDEDH